ncbi:peroxin-6 [Apiospora marii]|uniref:peroxin-6 n=1 Tax=Apiospora marii TaxID=335849 RepID=UPI003130BFDE
MTTDDLTPKRRCRRRRKDKSPITARLVLDEQVKGDIGIVSDDLFADLFPHLLQVEQDSEPIPSPTVPEIYHVALAPWSPNATPSETNWTIVPVLKSTVLAHSTIQFSPSSLALQNFATTLQQVAPSKLSSHSRHGIEVLVLDVIPLELDAVFVSLEGDLARRLENGEGTFFREHPAARGRRESAPDKPGEHLATALRAGLSTLRLVHNGDLFPLPLPPHPVTHVPSTPGKVTLCEPVAQGILGPDTRIILTRGHTSKQDRDSSTSSRALNGTTQDDGDDTATDQFYSAAEDRERNGATTAADSVTETETEASEAENEDDLSDDSMDEIISLQAPSLPATATSGVSTMQPGTPMTIGRGRKTNGISTPGSVFSSFTATTARPDRPKGRLFKTHGLVTEVPPDLLHPKPTSDDDEEARVYVDITSLTRIGCFSGDWVRVEASEEPPANGLGLFGLGSLVHNDSAEQTWRPAKIYGLPEGYVRRPMTRMPTSKLQNGGRRLSFFDSQVQQPASPGAYLSPILVANLDSTPYVRLSPLKRRAYPPRPGQAKITGSSRPPYAREVTLQQIRTPLSSERALQSVILCGLKDHFARRTRVVKTGDLVAIPVDTQLGRTLQDAPGISDATSVDDLLTLTASGKSGSSGSKPDGVAWLRVGHIARQKPENGEEEDEEDLWGGLACIDTSTTQIAQSGAVTSSIPGTKESSWRHYLGLEEAPKSTTSLTALTLPEQARRPVPPLRRRLRELIAAATSKRAIHLKMPPIAVLLVSTQRNIGKATLATEACSDIGLHTFCIDAYDILNEGGSGGGDVKTEGFLKARADRAMSCGPANCALLIRHLEALTADRMVTAMKEVLSEARVLIATTTDVDKVPDGVRGLFTHEMEMGAPDEGEREGILQSIIDSQGTPLAPEFDLGGVAIKTAALVAGDLVDVVGRALVAREARLEALSKRAHKGEHALFTLHPSVSLAAVAEKLPFTYTGADFYALCSDAMLKAVTRQATAVDAKIRAINADPATKHPISTANYFDHHATPEDIAVMVSEQDFLDADRELIPSVSAGELQHYERVRATFEGARDKQQQQQQAQDDLATPAAAQAGEQHFPLRPRSSGSGSSSIKGKGKGKAVAGAGDEEDEDGYESYNSGTNGVGGGGAGGVIKSNSSIRSKRSNRSNRSNKSTRSNRSKGKGKAVAKFQEGTASDDDGLY